MVGQWPSHVSLLEDTSNNSDQTLKEVSVHVVETLWVT